MVFLNLLLGFINGVLTIYMWIVVASAVITWVNPDPMNPIVRFLHGVTEPVLYRIRRLIPTNFGGIDISPMLLIFAILFVQHVLISGLQASLGGSAVVIR
jgi:YggT family protein